MSHWPLQGWKITDPILVLDYFLKWQICPLVYFLSLTRCTLFFFVEISALGSDIDREQGAKLVPWKHDDLAGSTEMPFTSCNSRLHSAFSKASLFDI